MAAAMAAARRSVLREGVVAGLIGAVVVAVWFLFFDLVRGRPFLTPGLLGGAVFRGVRTPVGLEITVANVLGYTLIHGDRKSTRLNSSHVSISYAVFC